MAVAGGHIRIRRLAINLAGTAGAEDRLLGPHEGLAVLGMPDKCAAAGTFVR